LLGAANEEGPGYLQKYLGTLEKTKGGDTQPHAKNRSDWVPSPKGTTLSRCSPFKQDE